MTSSVRILSTSSMDSSPAILLVAPNGNKTLVNCGEGCQRIFLEFGQKLSTVHRVCLTHLSHASVGGLPGMILTSADVLTASAIAGAKEKANKINNGDGSSSQTRSTKPEKRPLMSEEMPGLDLIGPRGTEAFIRCLRHFMRREAFELRTHEGDYVQQKQAIRLSKKQRRKANNSGGGSSALDEDFHLQSITCDHEGQQVMSFIFTSPRIQGKFLIEKAKGLGVPPGPLYGQLKSGKTVTFVHPDTGVEQSIASSEVVEPESPGIVVGILYYPNLDVLAQLQSSRSLNTSYEHEAHVDSPSIELLVHITKKDVFETVQCRKWRSEFGDGVDHLLVDTRLPESDFEDPGTPFHAASAGAMCRSKLATDIYLHPGFQSKDVVEKPVQPCNDNAEFKTATPLLEYTLMPRSKKGFLNHQKNQDHQKMVEKDTLNLLNGSGALDLTRNIQQAFSTLESPTSGEIIFTGTGSAIPCKHRNVSGIYLRMANQNAMLLDVGEGTIGQLLRAKPHEDHRSILRNIRAVWISHPHADHHLGILRLLSERNALGLSEKEAVIIIAPPNLNSFLEEYQAVDPSVSGSYIFMDCRDISPKAQPHHWSELRRQTKDTALARLLTELGISGIQAIPVAHCPHSYAMEVQGTPFGAVAYSGDCRPSMIFAEAAKNADLLIHEATFTDGMEAEAAVKRHSTVGEALSVAQRMRAKAIVLTHFSQRYPKIPPESNGSGLSHENLPVVFAFDYMKLTPDSVVLASKMTPVLRLLYPENEANDVDDELESATGANALAVPGLFAQNEIL